MYNAQKGLVRGEDSSSPCQSIALQKTLTHMLRENFDDSPTACIGIFIPLEIPGSMVEHCVEFIADKLVRRVQPYALRIVDKDLIKQATDDLHAARLSYLKSVYHLKHSYLCEESLIPTAFLEAILPPVWQLEYFV